MKLILSIGFDHCPGFFQIENPPVLPLEGEIFVCHNWAEFITDEKLLDRINEYDNTEGTGIYFTKVDCKEYSKNQVIVHISLVDEKDYRKK